MLRSAAPIWSRSAPPRSQAEANEWRKTFEPLGKPVKPPRLRTRETIPAISAEDRSGVKGVWVRKKDPIRRDHRASIFDIYRPATHRRYPAAGASSRHVCPCRAIATGSRASRYLTDAAARYPPRRANRARRKRMARSRISTGVSVRQEAMISSNFAVGIVRGTVESLRLTAGGTAWRSDGAHSTQDDCKA